MFMFKQNKTNPLKNAQEAARRRERRLLSRRRVIETLERRLPLAFDFGDAPDPSFGTGLGNYETLLANNGPRHFIDTTQTTLFLGAGVDAELNANPNSKADGDDRANTPVATDKDDEDGVIDPLHDLELTVGINAKVRLRATNLSGSSATLYGWIDVNRDGVFDNATERNSIEVPNASNNQTFTLNLPSLPSSTQPGTAFARFRLSTDNAASNPLGSAADGEVEDYVLRISRIADTAVDGTKSRRVSSGLNGGPVISSSNTYFGRSTAQLGDLDGDGVNDLAVGSGYYSQSQGGWRGVVYLLMMNPNGTVKSHTVFDSGAPTLAEQDGFGNSITALGDLDGDGVTELAVGAPFESSDTLNSGAVYTVFLNSNGTVKNRVRIASNVNGGPSLARNDFFGGSVTSVGDLNGDGFTELAVGAIGDSTSSGSSFGAIHILNLKPDGTVSSHSKIASGLNGGPTLQAGERLGVGLASIGDLDDDGVDDLAVGVTESNSSTPKGGKLYVLFLNSNGSVRSTTLIANGQNGGPILREEDYFGLSIASVGDLDGDGIEDLAVGAHRDDTGGGLSSYADRGAIYLLLMKADGAVKSFRKIANDTNGGPTLINRVQFGSSVSAIGDLDGDGFVELAVGAPGNNYISTFILFLKADTTAPALLSIERVQPTDELTNADTLTYRVTFDEDIINLDTGDFQASGSTTSAVTNVTAVSSRVYEITLSGGDLANYQGMVGLNLSNGNNLTDRSGNPLPLIEPTIDQTYELENTPPVFLSLTRLVPRVETTSANGLRFLAAFDEVVRNVDVTDFVVTGTTATLAMTKINESVYELGLAGGDLANLVGTVGINLAASRNIVDRFGNQLPLIEPAIDETYQLVVSNTDFGDASDVSIGTGLANYQTTLADNGPRHTIVAGLQLGVHIDSEPDSDANVDSHGAGDDRVYIATDRDDEDGVIEPAQDFLLTVGSAPQVRLRATNTTGSLATLYGWIDFNRDGLFDNASERTSVAVPTATNNSVFTLTFPTIPLNATTGRTFARFRLSTDLAAANSIGAAANGEVEDYVASISKISDATFDPAKAKKFDTTGASFEPTETIGLSVATIGDLDGDGVSDLVVGARNFIPSQGTGAAHVHFMNADGTVKNRTRISSGLNGGPVLSLGEYFGEAVASMGDLDGDGVVDIAVGASGDDTGGSNRGAVYLLFLNTNGTVKRSVKIAHNTNGGPSLANSVLFGSALTAIGDLDGDGVNDLAVGATNDLAGGGQGAVHIVLLNVDGTVKSSVKIAAGLNDAGSLVPGTLSTFGRSLASVGDLNGDGISDLAVGSGRGSLGEQFKGAVHLLLLNANGTVKNGTRIFNNTNGGPTLADFDGFGTSLTSLGDLDGDGITDLAVGADGDDTSGDGQGAVHVLLLNSNGTAKRTVKIANGIPGLMRYDFFGSAISLIDDQDGDGLKDLVVGAKGTNRLSSDFGAFNVVFLKQDTTSPILASIRRQTPTEALTNADTIVFRATFNEDVIGVDPTDFIVSGGTTANVTVLTPVSSFVYDIAIAGGNLASWNGTVGLDLAATQDITDRAINSLPTIEPTVDDVYTVDNIPPNLISIRRLNPTTATTSANTLQFLATFDGPVLNVDLSDFVVSGATATISVIASSSSVYTITLTDGNLPYVNAAVGINLALAPSISDAAGNGLTILEPTIDETFEVFNHPIDFGDAPDGSIGTGAGNYKTLLSDNGPRHTVSPNLRMGKSVDGELDGAIRDDLFGIMENDDEDGVFDVEQDLAVTVGSVTQVRLRASNTTGVSATLFGWVDFNRDGIFDNAIERTSVAVPTGTNNTIFQLVFPPVSPSVASTGQSYARFRLSTDAAAANPFGLATDGEVEDYPVSIGFAGPGTINPNKTVEIADSLSGGPVLVDNDAMGSAIASIGDLDGDGVNEQVVGAERDDTGGLLQSGAIYVQFMNANRTVKNNVKIARNLNGGPALNSLDYFGCSVASIGDIDGDGVNDLAVGAQGFDSGTRTDSGAVYILFLRADGTAKSNRRISSSFSGGPTLQAGDLFSVSLTSIGDFDGDGVPDLAVGATRDDTGVSGSNRGAVHLLYLNSNGSVKSSSKIANGTVNGPALVNNDELGSSIASIGDIDGDGVTDLTIGAHLDDTGGTNRGAIYIVRMNSDGTVKSSTKIANSTNGGPTLTNSDFFGRSVASLGDVNADGVNDLIVGARSDDTGGNGRGAVYLMYLNTNGTVGSSLKIANSLNGGPTLADADAFGNSVALLGDLDGDGTRELAVGATADDTGGTDRGAVYIFSLNARVSVVNRKVFYNQSTSDFFGNGTGNPINAIDPTKTALLPGQTTTAANYTNYSRGLNGIVIDVASPSNLAGISDASFQFATWSTFPDTTPNFLTINPVVTVSTFAGGGLNGSDRVKLEFTNNEIQNAWLRVTMLADTNTGLASNDVFYFGNARFDVTPTSPFPSQQVTINAFDVNAIRARQGQSPGIISNINDVDRNGVVNVFDTNAVRAGQGVTSLRSFTAPSSLQIDLASSRSATVTSVDALYADTSWLDAFQVGNSKNRQQRRS